MHTVHDDWFDAELYWPGAHAVQLDCDGDAEYVPAAQATPVKSTTITTSHQSQEQSHVTFTRS